MKTFALVQFQLAKRRGRKDFEAGFPFGANSLALEWNRIAWEYGWTKAWLKAEEEKQK